MTQTECDELQMLLQRHAGAHAHTVGKACFYLKALVNKPKARFSNCTQEEFVRAVRGAIAYQHWSALSNLMTGW